MKFRKYAIMYSKDGGNTRLLADTVKECFNKPYYFGLLNEDIINEVDLIFLGYWTDKGTCDPKTISFISKLEGKKVFTFGSAGFGSGDYFTNIINNVNKLLVNNEVIGSFMCQGKMPIKVKERYLKQKEDKVFIPNLDLLIENFDKALSHPDTTDLEALKTKLISLNLN